jgi:dTMP kinase
MGAYAPRPTATIVLDVPPEVCAERRRARAGAVELFDDPVVQARVCALYAQAADLLPPGGNGCPRTPLRTTHPE